MPGSSDWNQHGIGQKGKFDFKISLSLKSTLILSKFSYILIKRFSFEYKILSFKKRELLDIVSALVACREHPDEDFEIELIRGEVYHELNAVLDIHKEGSLEYKLGNTYLC